MVSLQAVMKEQLHEDSQSDLLGKALPQAAFAGSTTLAMQCKEVAVTARAMIPTFIRTTSRAAQC